MCFAFDRNPRGGFLSARTGLVSRERVLLGLTDLGGLGPLCRPDPGPKLGLTGLVIIGLITYLFTQVISRIDFLFEQ